MKKSYRQLDHTADLAIEVEGESYEQFFENAAFAMYDLMIPIDEILPERTVEISVTGVDTEDLLIRWLNELLFMTDMDDMLFSEFHVKEFKTNYLLADAAGERFKADKHSTLMNIKAATYHNIAILQDDTGVKATIVFDV